MVVDEFENHAPEDELNSFSVQTNELDNGTNLNSIGNDWHVLFPETIQEVNSNIHNRLPTHQEEHAHQTREIHDDNGSQSSPSISIDAITPLTSTESVGCHQKSCSLSSESSSDDLVLIGDHLNKQSSQDAYMHTELPDVHTKGSCNFFEPGELGNKDVTQTTPKLSVETPMKKPPIQAMNRDEEGYDPQRIPSTVFARSDSLIPAEWSLASNESLFSLHIGNSSIGREQDLFLSGELKKLVGSKLEEPSSNGDNMDEIKKIAGFSGEISRHSSKCTTPTIYEVENEGEVNEYNELQEKLITIASKSTKQVPNILMKSEKNKQHRPSSIRSSSVSNTSEESSCSFAFPVLEEGDQKNAPTKVHDNVSHQAHRQSIVLAGAVSPRRKRSCFSCFSCFSCDACSLCTPCPAFNACCSCNLCPLCSSCTTCICFKSCGKMKCCTC